MTNLTYHLSIAYHLSLHITESEADRLARLRRQQEEEEARLRREREAVELR